MPEKSSASEISPEALGFKGNLKSHSNIIFLPPALDIVPRLLVFLGDEEKDGEMLAELIRLDPGLTVNVLRVANSAAFATTYRMENLNSAVLRLGLREVFRIVLEVVASPMFQNASQPVAASLDLWSHAVRSAISAQTLAFALGEDRELAFTAGLLHDIGKLVFQQLLQEDYASMAHDAALQGAPLHLRETARFSTDHATVGARLLKRWNFPESITDCVHFHHDISRCPKPQLHLVGLIAAANLLAHKLARSEAEDGAPKAFPEYLLANAKPILKILNLATLDDLWSFLPEAKGAFERERERMNAR